MGSVSCWASTTHGQRYPRGLPKPPCPSFWLGWLGRQSPAAPAPSRPTTACLIRMVTPMSDDTDTPMPETDDDLITTGELCRALGVSRQWISILVKRGRLRRARQRRGIHGAMYARSEIDRILFGRDA